MEIRSTDEIEDMNEIGKEEARKLVSEYKESFSECLKACKKPNILVAGPTGTGKSCLINGIFGENITTTGIGKPITKHFERFELEELPLVVYDSKGLEWGNHESFIEETKALISKLRSENDVSEHIHCVYYVINAAKSRIDDFELKLLRDVIFPTPVIFCLNKADLADSEQLRKLREVIEHSDLKNICGIVNTIARRTNYTQNWCPKCLGDDVFLEEETKELECAEESCGHKLVLENTYGLEKLVELTIQSIPEFTREMFSFSQQISNDQKSELAKEVVKEFASKISIDVNGSCMSKLAEMSSRLFLIWGFPQTSFPFSRGIEKERDSFCEEIPFQHRLMLSTGDTIFGHRLSRGFAANLGLTLNQKLKGEVERLRNIASDKAIEEKKKKDVDESTTTITTTTTYNDVFLFSRMYEGILNPNFLNLLMKDNHSQDEYLLVFIEKAFLLGTDRLIDLYWDINDQEIEELVKNSKLIKALEGVDTNKTNMRLGRGNNNMLDILRFVKLLIDSNEGTKEMEDLPHEIKIEYVNVENLLRKGDEGEDEGEGEDSGDKEVE